jgi:oligo-1,6-glucosidase
MKTVEAQQKGVPAMPERKWWKEAVVYQVYPRSFKDSNGDGIGDLRGVIEKLDYIKSLGTDLVWLNPVYASPNDDNGYDISNYEDIMPEFGTMADFDALLNGLHEGGIRLLMDLVVNHTSDEHPWFKEARTSRDNPYYDYYIWWPAEKGEPPHRFSFFDPKGNAWEYEKATNAWYLHYFSKKQPDLNWDNPKVRQEIYKMMRFWFDKGVDGFRLDAITYISKDREFPFIAPEEIGPKYGEWAAYMAKGPHLHEYLQEMHREVLGKYDIVTIAETPGIHKKDALPFVESNRKELHMLYHFDGMKLGYIHGGFKRPDPAGYKLPDFKRIYTEWDQIFGKDGWGVIYLDNHDQPRMLTRWGNEAPEFRDASAKLLISFLLTMRATPIIYNGDELGMVNARFESIDEYRDIETLSMYENLRHNGGDTKQFLIDQQFGARDNSRTPFQWDATSNAGFTTGTPWIKINPNHAFINQQAQDPDPNSILNYFRRFTQFRKKWPVLVYGVYTLYDENHPQVYTYTRTMGHNGLLVMLNFSNDKVIYGIPKPLKIKRQPPVINNQNALEKKGRQLTLLPWQAVLFELAL